MTEELYVEDVIVPLLAIPNDDERLFKFLGSGFYLGVEGHLLTCAHVVDALRTSDRLVAYQVGKQRYLDLTIVKRSSEHDMVLCTSDPPGVSDPWPIVTKPYVKLGHDVELYAYCHEPLGPDQLPFRTRYHKGYITGEPHEDAYCQSYELNFPVLFGMSGAPLLRHFTLEGGTHQTGIVGCVYGSREVEIVKHSRCVAENHEERVSGIQELGMAYKPSVFFDLFTGTGVTMKVFGEMDG